MSTTETPQAHREYYPKAPNQWLLCYCRRGTDHPIADPRAEGWDACIKQIAEYAEHQTSRPFEVAEVIVGDLIDALDNPFRDGKPRP